MGAEAGAGAGLIGSMCARFLPNGSKKVLWLALLILTGPNGSAGGPLLLVECTDPELNGSNRELSTLGDDLGLLTSKLSRSTT